MSDGSVGRPAYDLVDEPWIPVLLLSGKATEVSIREVFARGREITAVEAELPTQTFAILRLLVAILHRVVDADAQRLTLERWSELWRGGLPSGDIDDYLERYRDRFDLLHPEHPFFQVAALATAKGETKDVAPLLFDVPSNVRLFTQRTVSASTSLQFAEAARALVGLQSFDPSGIRSGAVGDPRVKGGKGYPLGQAWGGQIGGLFWEGETLEQTLLLNLVGPGGERSERSGRPVWEREPVGPAVRQSAGSPDPYPEGPADLYTWQSRRVRLVHDGQRVRGSLVAYGDPLTPQNRFRDEPMTAWRHSKPQTAKLGQLTYMGREHQPERALWRGLSALLPGASSVTGEPAPFLVPGIVSWVAALIEAGALEEGTRMRLRAVGVVYGSNSSVVDAVIDDRVELPAALLGAEGGVVRAIERMIERAELGVQALSNLARNTARAAGASGAALDAPAARAREIAYADLDHAVRQLLVEVTDETSASEVEERWSVTLHRRIRALGAALVARADPVSQRIRVIDGKPHSAPLAERWFRARLIELFGPVTMRDRAETREGVA